MPVKGKWSLQVQMLFCLREEWESHFLPAVHVHREWAALKWCASVEDAEFIDVSIISGQGIGHTILLQTIRIFLRWDIPVSKRLWQMSCISQDGLSFAAITKDSQLSVPSPSHSTSNVSWLWLDPCRFNSGTQADRVWFLFRAFHLVAEGKETWQTQAGFYRSLVRGLWCSYTHSISQNNSHGKAIVQLDANTPSSSRKRHSWWWPTVIESTPRRLSERSEV